MLFRFDLIGINFGGNADEYDAEDETILPRLAACHGPDDVQSVVFQEFCQWFSPGVAGPRESYLGVSVAIWNWWQQRPVLEPSG